MPYKHDAKVRMLRSLEIATERLSCCRRRSKDRSNARQGVNVSQNGRNFAILAFSQDSTADFLLSHVIHLSAKIRARRAILQLLGRFAMSRIKIEDLAAVEDMTDQQMKAISGG